MGCWKILNKNIDDLIQIIGVNTEYKLVEIIRDVSVFFHISDIVYSHIFLSCQWQHYNSGFVVIGIFLANSSVG